MNSFNQIFIDKLFVYNKMYYFKWVAHFDQYILTNNILVTTSTVKT